MAGLGNLCSIETDNKKHLGLRKVPRASDENFVKDSVMAVAGLLVLILIVVPNVASLFASSPVSN